MWSLCSILIREGQDDEMVRVVGEAREACCRNKAKPVEAARHATARRGAIGRRLVDKGTARRGGLAVRTRLRLLIRQRRARTDEGLEALKAAVWPAVEDEGARAPRRARSKKVPDGRE